MTEQLKAEAAVVGDNGSLESLARELHMWYLEATKQLNPANYNPKAQVPYDDMHEEQKQIDRYIARKITNLLAAKDREREEKGLKVSTLWNRLFKYKWPVADALNPVARRLNRTKKV